MSEFYFNENSYEQALIELFQTAFGYNYQCGYDIVRDQRKPLIESLVVASLKNVNPDAPQLALDEAFKKLTRFSGNNLLINNELFTDWMQNGVEVSYYHDGGIKNGLVRLIDFDTPSNNDFLVVNQFTVVENAEKRPDIVVFVNGFPLVDIELKSCSRENTDSSQAYRQIRNRLKDIPSFYYYNAFCVISDMRYTKLGSITADEDRFIEWKSQNGDYEETRYAKYDTFFNGIFKKERLLDILRNFILFLKNERHTVKIVSQYHQYFAVNKAIGTTVNAVGTDGRAGVMWHTTGSGKSLSMVFYTKILHRQLKNMTVVVLTDRNDLDNQLFTTFAQCKDFLRQIPKQATSRKDLKKLLSNRQTGGIFFTTMQKFEESAEILSERRDIILIADEAHRNQYGLEEKVDKSTGKLSVGMAGLVRNSLPNATFIAFTGTPITFKDRNTREIFGEYIDIYDITQAVEDNATRPIYYESRIMRIQLDDNVLKRVDEEYEVLRSNADEIHIEKSKKQLASLDAVLGAEKTISSLCNDFIAHYEDRQHFLTGKAMFVAYSRPIAIKIYKKVLSLRPEWKDKIKVVMTTSNDDPEDWRDIVTSTKSELAAEFKNDDSEFKIAIVVDMWLTGFDVPSLATMYIFKPMKGHNLIQAISRVNRVFKDKEGGLVVDYAGIASHLKEAMKQFTARDQKNYGDNNIATRALPVFEEKLSICRDIMHGLDYSKFITGSDLDRANLIVDGINHVASSEKQKFAFAREAQAMKQSYTLCVSLLDKDTRIEFAFMEAIRSSLIVISPAGNFSLREINERISEILKHAVKNGGIINIFADNNVEFSIFNDKFLEEVAKMKQKNLAVELLKKLLADEIKTYKKINLVKSELFSDRMQRIINAYINGQISNIEVLEELMKLAEDIRADKESAKKLGLTDEEQAFYDALLKPQALKDFYENKNNELIGLVRTLTDMLNKNKTIDWQKRETERSKMRTMVKRLLKKYGYPPVEIPKAIEYVISQCEQWADNLTDDDS